MRPGIVIAAAFGFSAAVLLYELRALAVDSGRAWGVVASRLDGDRGKLRERFDALPEDEQQRVVDEVRTRRAARRDDNASGSGRPDAGTR